MADFLSQSGLKKIELKLRKGMALIWAANLFPGGSPIIDKSRSRHSQVTHYYFSDCLYYTPLLSDPFSGRMFIRDIIDIATGKKVNHYYQGAYFSIEELYLRQQETVLGQFSTWQGQKITSFLKKAKHFLLK